jgi:hypothetical protein
MKPEQDQFPELRRLLALKRYEQPPPGYFDGFSRQVIVRIRAGERAEEVSFREFFSWEAPWLRRFWAMFEAKPILAGGFGVAVCGLLLAGMLYSEPNENNPFPNNSPLASIPSPEQHTLVNASAIPGTAPVFEHAAVTPLSGVQGVMPVQATDSLFQQLSHGQTQPGNVRLINVSVPR